MGDEIPDRRQAELTDDTADQSRINITAPYTNTPIPQPQAMEFANYPTQPVGQQHYSNPSSFNMASMSNMLSDYQVRGYAQQPFQYQLQPGAQFAGQNAPIFNPNFQHQYAIPNQQSRPPMQYSQFGGMAPQGPQGYGQPQLHQQQAALQNMTHQYISQNQPFFQQSSGNYGASYHPRSSGGDPMGQMRPNSSIPSSGLPSMQTQGLPEDASRNNSEASLRVSVPRGPPRKPKQSGHALWVGNLPPGTSVVDLKDHFSRDATNDIESVFLISKSNCAFVNYKTETSCASAMSRFHDSRFQGVRLVCRLRRGSTPGSVNLSGQFVGQALEESAPPLASAESAEEEAAEDSSDTIDPPVEKTKEKYFIVKSLTIEDLEMSARNGTWATQAHNEKVLNQAYQSSENVYLIFSANKSGEYFGYARMASAIDDDTDAPTPPTFDPETVVGSPQRPAPSPSEQPITIPTPATATAPKGHIIDDSARGTIFWEAEGEEEEGPHNPEEVVEGSAGVEDTAQSFGKPFKIEWMSTERLPFYRTRGLRNPWNSNREVKIARDGTELEPSVGRRLVSIFHRPMVGGSPRDVRVGQQGSGGTGYPRGY